LKDIQAEIEARVHEASLHDPFLSNHQPRIEYHGHMLKAMCWKMPRFRSRAREQP